MYSYHITCYCYVQREIYEQTHVNYNVAQLNKLNQGAYGRKNQKTAV